MLDPVRTDAGGSKLGTPSKGETNQVQVQQIQVRFMEEDAKTPATPADPLLEA